MISKSFSIVLTTSIKPSQIACKQQTNCNNHGNPQPLDLPFHPCHGRFMHYIGYVFWRAFHVFTGFAVCHNLIPKYFLCLQKFGRGKGKGGFFPYGVAITVPYLILSHARKKNQLPKSNLISVVITPPATA